MVVVVVVVVVSLPWDAEAALHACWRLALGRQPPQSTEVRQCCRLQSAKSASDLTGRYHHHHHESLDDGGSVDQFE